MSPKPILKRSVSEPAHKTLADPYHTQGYPNRAHGVHFPPSPATCTYSAYSASAYDRSPIVVTPNNCALPERGGRAYTLDESQPRRGISFARDFHPRALAFASSRSDLSDLPQLIPDVSSSESDESDGDVENFPISYGRRRGERETKCESSTDRIPSRGSDNQHCLSAFVSLSISASPTFSTTPKKRSTKKKQLKSPHSSYTPTSGGFNNLDDGCLGGF